jgi:hypothetical protein
LGVGGVKMTEGQQLRVAFRELSKALSEAFSHFQKVIYERLNNIIELRKRAQEYINKKKAARKGWMATTYHLKNQVNMSKPFRAVARSCC